MDMQRAYILLEEADKMLQSAEEEMMRAEEDVIAHSVCFNSRQAILNYLTFFLFSRGVRPETPITMAGLMEQCRAIDPRFENLSLANIQCRHDKDEKEYCLSTAQVGQCFKVAGQARSFIKG
jgi:hypothetical protein